MTVPQQQIKPQQPQRTQQARQPRQRQQQQQAQPEDYAADWLHKNVEVVYVGGKLIGSIIDVSRYWIKILVNGEVIYLNKAHIITIRLMQR